MGDRNHLHICRHCGIVQATASETGPEMCIVCGGITFSQHHSNTTLGETQVEETDGEMTSERAFERTTVESVR